MHFAQAAAALLFSTTAAAGSQASATFERLERALREARQVTVVAELRAQGAVTAGLSARIELAGANRLLVEHSGQFAGAAVQSKFVCASLQCEQIRNGQTFGTEAGAESNRAALLGLTRMGLMHNLAVLGAQPGVDHASGGADAWVQVSRLRYLGPKRAAAGPTRLALAFDITVAGRPAGSAQLWLDEETQLPVRRVQQVQFPQGTMTVEENYSTFLVE